MTAHLKLICHAATAATRDAAFPSDEALDARGKRMLAAERRHLRRPDHCLTSPARRAIETAEGLGLAAMIEPELRDCDCGRWSGRSIRQVEEQEPEALAEWRSDPAKAPHGGESILALIERTAAWLDTRMASRGVTLAITHASVIRAAVIVAIEAEPRSFWRIDVAPLSLLRLSGHQGRWNLRSLGALAEDSSAE